MRGDAGVSLSLPLPASSHSGEKYSESSAVEGVFRSQLEICGINVCESTFFSFSLQ